MGAGGGHICSQFCCAYYNFSQINTHVFVVACVCLYIHVHLFLFVSDVGMYGLCLCTCACMCVRDSLLILSKSGSALYTVSTGCTSKHPPLRTWVCYISSSRSSSTGLETGRARWKKKEEEKERERRLWMIARSGSSCVCKSRGTPTFFLFFLTRKHLWRPVHFKLKLKTELLPMISFPLKHNLRSHRIQTWHHPKFLNLMIVLYYSQ